MCYWLPIEECITSEGLRAIVAVPDKDEHDHIVGEAYYHKGEWWWASMLQGDGWSEPISETNFHTPSHFQPLPAGPNAKRLLS